MDKVPKSGASKRSTNDGHPVASYQNQNGTCDLTDGERLMKEYHSTGGNNHGHADLKGATHCNREMSETFGHSQLADRSRSACQHQDGHAAGIDRMEPQFMYCERQAARENIDTLRRINHGRRFGACKFANDDDGTGRSQRADHRQRLVPTERGHDRRRCH